MDRLKVAARFVAFTCYLNGEDNHPLSPEAAGRYARGNWRRVFPYVREDLGRLLTSLPPRMSDRPAPTRKAIRRKQAV
jgi:hypothetical protein